MKMVLSYLVALLGIAGIIVGTRHNLVLANFLGGGAVMAALRIAYAAGLEDQR